MPPKPKNEDSSLRRSSRRRASSASTLEEDGESETADLKKKKKTKENAAGKKRRKEEEEGEDEDEDGSATANPEENSSSSPAKSSRTPTKKGAKSKDSAKGTGKQTKASKRSRKTAVTKVEEEDQDEDMADAGLTDGGTDNKDSQADDEENDAEHQEDVEDDDEDGTFIPKTAKPTVVRAKKDSKPKKETKATKKATTTQKQSAPKKKREKKPDHQRVTDRDELPKLWKAEEAREKDGSYTMKIISWNVAGLRAMLRNSPTALTDLVSEQCPDVLCLQETKLQESHLDDPKQCKNPLLRFLLSKEGYDAYYNCSTAKKGYSGTAVFLKRRRGSRDPPPPPPQPVAKVADEEQDKGEQDEEKDEETSEGKKQAKIANFFTKDEKPKRRSSRSKKSDEAKEETGEEEEQEKFIMEEDTAGVDVDDLIPQVVSYVIGKEEHDYEGRVITLEFPLFTMSNVYVPNSGQELARLTYRTENWDGDLVDFMKQKLGARKLPVLWAGDLNVAHTFRDVWNDGAKHLAKQAGTTPEERASFDRQLGEGFVDAFRRLHPEAMGQYTYWSMRAGNREPNKGLRLDYFIGSQDLFEPLPTPPPPTEVSGVERDIGASTSSEEATSATSTNNEGESGKDGTSQGTAGATLTTDGEAGDEDGTSGKDVEEGAPAVGKSEHQSEQSDIVDPDTHSSPSPHQSMGRVQVRDSYMLYGYRGSDHCPIVLELEIRKH